MTKPWDPAVTRSVIMLAFVLLLGTAGYVWIEGWGPWRALFFTLVTVTTVGYGDYGLSAEGERFTAIVMLGGIGTVSFALSQVLSGAVARTLRPERRMIQRAKQLKGHHIICGYGRMGQRIGDRLREAGVPFVVIDRDAARVMEARAERYIALEGDATEDETLHHANLLNAKTVAAITSSDAVNALICLTAHDVAPNLNIIARAEQESSICKLRRAGANTVLSPSVHGADHVTEHLLHPEVARVLFPEDGWRNEQMRFAQVAVTEDSPLLGRDVRSVGQDHPKIVFVAARSLSGELSLRPEADRRLKKGDVLVIAGDSEEIASLHAYSFAA